MDDKRLFKPAATDTAILRYPSHASRIRDKFGLVWSASSLPSGAGVGQTLATSHFLGSLHFVELILHCV